MSTQRTGILPNIFLGRGQALSNTNEDAELKTELLGHNEIHQPETSRAGPSLVWRWGFLFRVSSIKRPKKIPKTKHASTRIGHREALGRRPPAISARRRKTVATQPNTTDYYSPAKEKEWISVPHPEQRGEPRSGGPRERGSGLATLVGGVLACAAREVA
jgi:hypothetical protein